MNRTTLLTVLLSPVILLGSTVLSFYITVAYPNAPSSDAILSALFGAMVVSFILSLLIAWQKRRLLLAKIVLSFLFIYFLIAVTGLWGFYSGD
jgi:hypothetical protein